MRRPQRLLAANRPLRGIMRFYKFKFPEFSADKTVARQRCCAEGEAGPKQCCKPTIFWGGNP
jgi:hypothetical protein